MAKFIRANWIVIGIFALAAFFRFWQITALPAGLFPDEAANGLDVNSILDGDIKPFYERGNGREALFFYFLAASVALFGRGVWQHHIVSAGFGLASVIALYFLAKKMFGQRTALLASFLMAVSSYPVLISRTAFRANLVPFFSILALYFLVSFFETSESRKKYWYAALSGLSLALGFYTYFSFPMMVPLIILFGLLMIRTRKIKIKELAAFGGSFLLGFSWLGFYFLSHPQALARAGQVSIFTPDLSQGDLIGTFLRVLKSTILGFFTLGDSNFRHNVSGLPFLSPFISPFFALGLAVMSKAGIYSLLTAAWFIFMLIPELATAQGIPHGLRLIGVIPPMFIIAAWGLNWVWDKFKSRILPQTRLWLAFVFFFSIFVYNYYAYFVIAAGSPEYYREFRSDLTVVSNYLNSRDQKNQTYLSLDKFSVQTVEYLTTTAHQPYMLVVPENTYTLKLKSGDQVVFTQSTIFDSTKFLQAHPDAQLIIKQKNKFGEPIMLVYQKP